jgi:cytoskeleton protein RodZ
VNGEDEVRETGTAPLVGEQLCAAREQRQLSIEDVAATTRIPGRHLRAIESGDYSGLPATTYSAGFVKTVANHLGLDGPTLAAQFRAEMGGAKPESAQSLPYEPADPHRTPPLGLALLGLVAAVVLVLGYLYWRGSAEEPAQIAATASDQAPAPTPNATRPLGPVGPAPAATGSSQGPVVIGASQDVWIKVSDGGKTLFLGLLHPGDRFEVPVSAVAPLLTTGRPGSTNIQVGQTPIPPVGDPDRLAKDVSLKAADLIARLAPPPVQPAANATMPVENAAGPI